MNDTNKREKDLENFPLSNNQEASTMEEFPGRSQTREGPHSRTRASMASWATLIAFCAALVAVAFYDEQEVGRS
jgi:hypothetical protein